LPTPAPPPTPPYPTSHPPHRSKYHPPIQRDHRPASLQHLVPGDANQNNNTQAWSHTWDIPGQYNVTCVGANGNGSVSIAWNVSVHDAEPPADTTPPAGVTALINSTYEKTFINWTWSDPLDADFSKVMVYLDGGFKTNITKGAQYYNAAGLSPDTVYTISTHTVDTSGNVNQDTYLNESDLDAISEHFNEIQPTYALADVNGNGTVDIYDVILVSSKMKMMKVSQLALKIPGDVVDALRLPPDEVDAELHKELALALYQRGMLSSGKACRLAGMTRWEFEELLGQRKILRWRSRSMQMWFFWTNLKQEEWQTFMGCVRQEPLGF
jgi:hypothetical protein